MFNLIVAHIDTYLHCLPLFYPLVACFGPVYFQIKTNKGLMIFFSSFFLTNRHFLLFWNVLPPLILGKKSPLLLSVPITRPEIKERHFGTYDKTCDAILPSKNESISISNTFLVNHYFLVNRIVQQSNVDCQHT